MNALFFCQFKNIADFQPASAVKHNRLVNPAHKHCDKHREHRENTDRNRRLRRVELPENNRAGY